MGYRLVCMGDNALNGLLPGGSCSVFLFSTSHYDERWAEAESRTADVIGRIQPSRPSEERRKSVIEYVERLIKKYFDSQVCTFGSVPLKTYLPDGDIDLTAFSWLHHINDTWANDLRNILQIEEHNKDAKFHVKEVQCIQAEVQIVKCLVENIVVDISFNQLGGLCTLCFLEEVDQLIGKDHLFKRSIILIKAWCYYESRILGAHHGLISTYALETLVLYIFHVFHASLRGPLEVLFRFLQFFSKFDWEHYCLSLWGPIHLSALQDMAAEPPQKHGGQLLLSHAFLYACSQAYAVLPAGQDNQGRIFSSKYMNVVDPLRTNNNLGRSISRGSFYRIRSAFAYGARKLEKILCGSNEELAAKLDDFFLNTKKHCTGVRPDAPASGLNCSKAEGENQSSDLKLGQPKMSIGARDYANLVMPSEAVTGSVSAKAVNVSQENVDQVFRSGEAMDDALDHHGNAHDTRSTITRGKARKGMICRSRNASVPVSEVSRTTTRRRAKGTDSITAARMSKQNESLDIKSDPLANAFRRGNLANAKDLASCQDVLCASVMHENLQRETSISDSNSVSAESGSICALSSSLSHTEESSRIVHDQNSPLCRCEDKTSGRRNQPCSGPLLVPSTVQTSATLVDPSWCFSAAGSFQSVALHDVLSIATQCPPSAHITKNDLPASQDMAVLPTSVLEQQYSIVLKEHQESKVPSFLRSTTSREVWGSSTNTLSHTQKIVPPELSLVDHRSDLSNKSSHVASASHEIVECNSNFEGCNDTSPVDSADVEARLALTCNGCKGRRVQGGNESKNENRSNTVQKDCNLDHFHVSANTASGINGHSSCHQNVSGPEAPSSLHGDGKEDKELEVEMQSGQMTSGIGKAINDQDLTLKSNADSVDFKDAKQTKTGFVLVSRDNITSNNDHAATITEVLQSLAANENEKTVGASGGSSASPTVVCDGEKIPLTNGSCCPSTDASNLDATLSERRQGDYSGMVPFTYFAPCPLNPFLTAPNMPIYNMNSLLDGKARFGRGTCHRTDQIANSLDTPNDEQAVLGVGEIVMPSGIIITSGSRVEAKHSGPISDVVEPEVCHDILRGDFPTHLHNLHVGRWFQNTHLYGPLLFTSALFLPSSHMQEQYAWEAPGRPRTRDINMFTQILANRHGQFPNPILCHADLLHSFALSTNKMYREEMPKFHRGTGTYLPNLMSGSYRGRQLITGGRGSCGMTGFDCLDPVNQDGDNVFPSRYRGMARGQGRHEGRPHTNKVNTHVERKVIEKGWNIDNQEKMFTSPLSGFPVRSSMKNIHNASDYATADLGPPLKAYSKNNSQIHIGKNIKTGSGTVRADPYGNDKVCTTNNMQFGSLDSTKLLKAQQVTIQDGAGQDCEGLVLEDHQNFKQMEPSKACEMIGKKVPIDDNLQSSSQCSYELKDEDFPPLPFYGQARKSSGFDIQTGSAKAGPNYQACLVGSTSF